MTKMTITASCSIGPILHRNGVGHRCAKSGTASAIFATGLDAPREFRQPLTTGRRFLIHCPELDTELTYRKQKVGIDSNRQFFAFLKLPDTPRRSANFSQTGLV